MAIVIEGGAELSRVRVVVGLVFALSVVSNLSPSEHHLTRRAHLQLSSHQLCAMWLHRRLVHLPRSSASLLVFYFSAALVAALAFVADRLGHPHAHRLDLSSSLLILDLLLPVTLFAVELVTWRTTDQVKVGTTRAGYILVSSSDEAPVPLCEQASPTVRANLVERVLFLWVTDLYVVVSNTPRVAERCLRHVDL